MAKELGLTIKGKDEASKVIKGVTEETKGLTKATDKQSEASKTGGLKFTEMLSALSLAKQAMQAVEQVIDQTVGAWLEHTIAVSDFNAMIDGNIEETSVLMELYDDFGVTMDTGLAAMRSLAKNGYEPNIEGLIKLREQLDGTTNAADRLKLAQQLIGEQGIKQILPMLDQLTNEQLRNYVDTLTEAEMVTRKEEEAARDLQKALSDFGDQVDNAKMQVGGLIVDGLLPLIRTIEDLKFVMDNFLPSEEKFTDTLVNSIGPLGAISGALKSIGIGLEHFHDWLEPIKQQLGDTEFRLKQVKAAGDRWTAGMRDTQTAAEDAALAVDGVSSSALRLQIVEAVRAGQYNLAKQLAEAYRQAKSLEEQILKVVEALIAADGTSANMFLTLTQSGPVPVPGSPGPAVPGVAGGGGTVSFRGRTFQDAYWRGDTLMVRGQVYGTFPGRQQHGGEFTVGGAGGIDSQPVGFMATPGEKVKVTPPGASDNVTLVEMRSIRDSIAYMVDMLPAALRDAVAQGM